MNSEVISNWQHFFEDFEYSTEEFYTLLNEELKSRKIPGYLTKTKWLKQGGLFSQNRLYFEVKSGDYIFHICGAPYGTGYFFSWWLRIKLSFFQELLLKIPYIGDPIVNRLKQKTYFQIDTENMFKSSVHSAVLATIEKITKPKAVRPMTETERRPVDTNG